MSDALLLEDVVVRIGETLILDRVSLDIPNGRIVAVVGANGAGKTTLLDVISGVSLGTTGTVLIDGVPNGGNGKRRAGIGRVFQGSPLPETLTVAEVVSLVARDRESSNQLMARFGLSPHATTFVAELSTGMRRILDLAVATVGQPRVLLLDEPASGLAQSEIEHLADVVRAWRDATGSAVIIVEHDASLVKALADEVVVMDAGRIAERGTVDDVLAASRARSQPRIRSPHDEQFHDALARIDADAVPTAALPKRTLSKWTLMRLGLRELSAGIASVMILGILSSVLKHDLKISLGVVTAVLATYNLAAPLAVAIGHRSDTHPIFGLRRTPYIIGGALLTGLAVAAAPHVASRLAGGVTVGAVVLSVLLFAAMGLGMSGAGSVFLALLTDRSGPSERGHTASVVYLELMVGVLVGVGLTGAILKDNATTTHGLPPNVGTLFAIVGVLVFVLSTIAVWGQEKKVEHSPVAASHRETPKLRASLKGIGAIPQARLFFVFMVASMMFLFLLNAILSSFSRDVLNLSLRGAGNLQAMMTIGTIVGMVVAGRPFAEQIGHRKIAFAGLFCAVVSLSGLAAGAAASAPPPVWLSILLFGFASGLFTVSTLALMMGMSDRRRTALFMGAWTLARALADGSATAGGGLLYELGHKILHSVPGGYATVFAIQAIGLAACIPLLKIVDPNQFAAESRADPGLALAAAFDPAAFVTDEALLEDSARG